MFISMKKILGYSDDTQLPSPLEVNRFISVITHEGGYRREWRLPSPLEVYRFISRTYATGCFKILEFPSPLEVYRFIS